jgi:5S rRNA maturation endonuclease (ribonuclease M5)
LDVLAAQCNILDDWLEDGERYPLLGFTNGVRWFFDKTRRPLLPSGHQKKAMAAPGGDRGLLGDLAVDGDLVLVEGERDWLTALSLGIDGAVCVGGAVNLTEGQKHLIAGHTKRRTAIVLFDNDGPGREAAEALAAHLKLADCKTVKIARIPLENGDLSDWVESLDPKEMRASVLALLQGADVIKKGDAAKLLKAQEKPKDAEAFKRETDSFVTASGDPVFLIIEPADRALPHKLTSGSRLRFLHYDQRKSEATGSLVVNVCDQFEESAPLPDVYTLHAQRQSRPPVLLPMQMDDNGFQWRVCLLPSGAREHGTTEQLYDDLYAFIDRYLVADPEFMQLLPGYVLLTYRYLDAGFETLPYIGVTGPSGKGKTRMVRIMREICYRAVMFAEPHACHIYRALEQLKQGATLCFEELNLDPRTEDGREFHRILNAGYQNEMRVPRMTGQRYQKMQHLEIFCPKIFGLPNALAEPGIIRRTLMTRVGDLPVPPEKVFEALPVEFYQEAAELRERLMGWRLSKYSLPCPPPKPELREEAVDLGVWQTLYPLIAMVPEGREHIIKSILRVGGSTQSELHVIQDTSEAGQVLESIMAVAAVDGDEGKVWLTDVQEDLEQNDRQGRWDLQKIYRVLRELRLTNVRASRTMRDGSRRSDRYVRVDDDNFQRECRLRRTEIIQQAEQLNRDEQMKEIM